MTKIQFKPETKKKEENITKRKYFHPHCFPRDRRGLFENLRSKNRSSLWEMDSPEEDKKTQALKAKIKKENLKIVSSSYGLIKHILFIYPNVGTRKCKDRFKLTFMDLLLKMAEVLDDFTITVLAWDASIVEAIIEEVEERHGDLFEKGRIKTMPDKKDMEAFKKKFLDKLGKPEFEAWASPDTDIDITQMEKDFSVWAQDPFVILNSPDPDGKVYFFEPSSYLHRPIDAFIANVLEEKYSGAFHLLPLISQGFNFQGGNILAGKDFLLVGMDSVEGEEKKYKTDLSEFFNIKEDNIHIIKIEDADLKIGPRAEYIKNLRADQLYNNHIRYYWKVRTQPLFHIDLFISLAGKSEEGKERLVIPYIVSIFQEAQASVELLNIYLQELVYKLHGKGFEIHRNPIPLMPMDYENTDGEEKREWYFGLYNNSLIQIGKAAKDKIPKDKIGCIWMPTYGHYYGKNADWRYLKMYDDANAAIWENLGFLVKRLTDYNVFSFKKGGPHCILKCLKRTDA